MLDLFHFTLFSSFAFSCSPSIHFHFLQMTFVHWTLRFPIKFLPFFFEIFFSARRFWNRNFFFWNLFLLFRLYHLDRHLCRVCARPLTHAHLTNSCVVRSIAIVIRRHSLLLLRTPNSAVLLAMCSRPSVCLPLMRLWLSTSHLSFSLSLSLSTLFHHIQVHQHLSKITRTKFQYFCVSILAQFFDHKVASFHHGLAVCFHLSTFSSSWINAIPFFLMCWNTSWISSFSSS